MGHASAARPAAGGSRIRRIVLDKVRALGPTEHDEIFRLLDRHGIAYSSNSNGIFVNLSIVPDDVVLELKAFVDYCAENKKTLDSYEEMLQLCKATNRYDRMSVHAAEEGEAAEPRAATSAAEEAQPPLPAVALPVQAPGSGSVLITGRFQASRKRFSRRRVGPERKAPHDAGDGGTLTPEAYTYTYTSTHEELAGSDVDGHDPGGALVPSHHAGVDGEEDG